MKHINLVYIAIKFAGLALCILICSCKKKEVPQKQFTLLDTESTGILFSNDIKETDSLNYFNYPYLYMGGGVSAGDFDNDGLTDLFFTSNMKSNKLYHNQGDFKFIDITKKAKVSADKRWFTGTTAVDINNDGFLDIYASVSGKEDNRENLLYINNGDLTFRERAKEFGINDNGHTTQATFFDYNNDGYLDLYLANYTPTPFKSPSDLYAYRKNNPRLEASDKLYKNNGDDTFLDVTEASGILNFGLSLSATSGDFNNDGWQDIYISNDFDSPDFFYINNGDGTFKEVSQEVLGHTAQYGMGVDVADYNNDLLLDFGQVDMTPEDNRRSKENMASMNPLSFKRMVDQGLFYQYMQNNLQLNRGVDANGNLKFSEVSRLAGIATTDWSWAILFSDLDNDGWKDIIISNGTRRDINNRDYFKKLSSKLKFNKTAVLTSEEIQNIPSEKISNYVFKNKKDLSFENVTKDWGWEEKTFSNGMTYADLDNDGDLDVVINNIDQPASVYRNNNSADNNTITVKLNGPKNNRQGIGAKVYVTAKDLSQLQQLTLTRGFQSSIAPKIHFGLGKHTLVDELKVVWPDGTITCRTNLDPNQQIILDHKDAVSVKSDSITKNSRFKTVDNALFAIDYTHTENEYDDYLTEPLLPYKTSALGPSVTVGDINNDGLDDFFIGGAAYQIGKLFVQEKIGKFIETNTDVLSYDRHYEDMDALFFDFDNDGDNDLYVVSGGNEYETDSEHFQDRIYINDGAGNFKKGVGILPQLTSSGSRLAAADYDKDGDIDLFVAGRLVSGKYPWPASSYVLNNENGVFKDVTSTVAPDFNNLGMVTDAIWTDFNNDTQPDLVIVGEWMSIGFYANENGRFKNVTGNSSIENTAGWWSSIAQADFDNDGDMDFVAGNLGLNYKYQATPEEPFEVFADDFDHNGRKDIVLSYYNFGKLFPLRGRSCSSQQIPALSEKFKDYGSFAGADVSEVYGKEALEDAEIHYKVQTFASSYIENLGDGRFRIKNLPNKAQFSSVNQMLIKDIDYDGFKDILLAGNLYASEVETPRNDSGLGLYLKGNGKGQFTPVPNTSSGLYINGDVKDFSQITIAEENFLIIAKNNDEIQLVKITSDIN
ncbi:VCBS repeat-containing protein [Flagellimonas sp. CMM7]|uniref:VCBS repeat-containing protein n=1 Tax=Flagellimonas sp. CMM7 TaxID=2654676 RepID=UPI0013CF7086|nr:VCBS repeat-containing protein [Flagellimonas sp. CMM7]UII80391.1 VCBS repeat-containing protein [Flagellimonas sp. CMM7]